MYQAVAKRTGRFKQASADKYCRKLQNVVTGGKYNLMGLQSSKYFLNNIPCKIVVK